MNFEQKLKSNAMQIHQKYIPFTLQDLVNKRNERARPLTALIPKGKREIMRNNSSSKDVFDSSILMNPGFSIDENKINGSCFGVSLGISGEKGNCISMKSLYSNSKSNQIKHHSNDITDASDPKSNIGYGSITFSKTMKRKGKMLEKKRTMASCIQTTKKTLHNSKPTLKNDQNSIRISKDSKSKTIRNINVSLPTNKKLDIEDENTIETPKKRDQSIEAIDCKECSIDIAS